MYYECGCGYEFDESLGKYGCPDCCGENVAKLKLNKLKMNQYDSTADTLKHIKRVSELLTKCSIELIERASRRGKPTC